MFVVKEKWRQIAARLLAEFAIVALGVTIALWADGWVAERGDRQEEIARLHALEDNIVQTLSDLQEASDNASGAADALRTLATQSDLRVEEQRRQLRLGLLYGPSFSPELNVYDDLKNSGELALLTNRNLRRSLATMDARLEVLQLAQSDLAAVQQLDIDSFVVDETELRLLYGGDLGLDWMPVEEGRDFAFTSDVRFRNLILLKLDLVTQLESRFTDADASLQEVRQIIAAQLGADQ